MLVFLHEDETKHSTTAHSSLGVNPVLVQDVALAQIFRLAANVQS